MSLDIVKEYKITFLDSESLISITSAINFNESGGNTISRLRNTGAVKKGCSKTEYPIRRSIFDAFQNGGIVPSGGTSMERYAKSTYAKSTTKMYTFWSPYKSMVI